MDGVKTRKAERERETERTKRRKVMTVLGRLRVRYINT